MAETFGVANTFALTASSTKAFAQIVTSSSQACRLILLDVAIDDLTKTTQPLIQVVRFTGSFTAATGGTGFTPDKMNGEGQNGTFGPTVTVGAFTTEAAVGSGTLRVVKNWYASAQGYLWPLGREVYLPPSVTTVLRVVTGSTIPANLSYNFELET